MTIMIEALANWYHFGGPSAFAAMRGLEFYLQTVYLLFGRVLAS